MTSRFARLSVANQLMLIAILTYVPTLFFPYAAQAQTTQNQTRLVFEINTVHKVLYPDPEPVVSEPAPQIDPNIAIVKDYLTSKGSPLADHVETLLQQENWKLVLAISNGESTMCKHQMYNNCWGIGGAWNLKRYDSLEDAIPDVNNLLTNKYVAMGADTPQKMVKKYVGHPNSNWVLAANQVLAQLDQLPLSN